MIGTTITSQAGAHRPRLVSRVASAVGGRPSRLTLRPRGWPRSPAQAGRRSLQAMPWNRVSDRCATYGASTADVVGSADSPCGP
jgi:hypothetical protein